MAVATAGDARVRWQVRLAGAPLVPGLPLQPPLAALRLLLKEFRPTERPDRPLWLAAPVLLVGVVMAALVVGLINSVLSLHYYLRVLAPMFVAGAPSEADDAAPAGGEPVARATAVVRAGLSVLLGLAAFALLGPQRRHRLRALSRISRGE